jgi:D-glycero-D-manno-heptose 1,7-bisphosphate phosphatase
MLELGGQPASTVVVGDNASDVGLGRALGALSVLVRTGYGVRTEQALPGGFDLVVDSLAELPEALARRCVAD